MSITKQAWVSVAVVLLVTGAALAGSVMDKIVQITDKGYEPSRIEIVVGQNVVFQNATRRDHTVTSKNPAGESAQDKDKVGFDSGAIKPGTSWQYAFSKEGTYTFYCKEDKTMVGTIIVTSEK